MTPADAQEVLSRIGWLSAQPRDLRDALLAEAAVRTLPVGGMLYALDDPPGGLYGIADGFVDVMIAPGPFAARLVHVGGVGWWVGEAALLTGTPRRAEVRARTIVTILYVPKLAVTRLTSEKPHLWRDLATLTVDHLDAALLHAAALASDDLELRLLATLARLVGPRAAADAIVDLPIGHAELAELTGLSRNSVARLLTRLSQRGCVGKRYRSIVVNVPRMEKALVTHWAN